MRTLSCRVHKLSKAQQRQVPIPPAFCGYSNFDHRVILWTESERCRQSQSRRVWWIRGEKTELLRFILEAVLALLRLLYTYNAGIQ